MSQPIAVSIRIPTPLRAFTGGVADVEVEGRDVRSALAALLERHPGLAGRVTDEGGELRRFVNLFVGQRNVRAMGGLDTPLAPGDQLSILPAVAGGAP